MRLPASSLLAALAALAALGVAAPSTLGAQAVARAPSPREVERAVDAEVARGMRDWHIPGLSIAVVRGDSVLLAKGYGRRTLGRDGAVDAHTLFGMMSTTKAMTALGIALLVDEGKVAWGDPVSKWLPWFQLPDGYATRDLRVVDLLTHNAGLGNADLLWARGDLSTREILERVRRLTPAYPLRGGFSYQNLMYEAAGQVIAAASGQSWAEFTTARILRPLGMTRSYATLQAMAAAGDANVSTPHYRIRDTVRVIRDVPVDPVPAAGAAWTTAADAARWTRFWLDSGRVGGIRLVSDSSFRRLWAPHVVVPVDEFYPTAARTRPHWTTYGLGWFQQDFRGRMVQFHTGSMDGRTAIIGLIPDERIGVYILGNLDHAEFRHALMFTVFDLLTGAPRRDWSGEFLRLYDGLRQRADSAQAAAAARRVTGTTPRWRPADVAGTYTHPVWGELVLEAAGDGVRMRYGPEPEFAGVLGHWHHDTWRGELGDGRAGPVTLTVHTGPDGAVASVTLEWLPDQPFVRKRPA